MAQNNCDNWPYKYKNIREMKSRTSMYRTSRSRPLCLEVYDLINPYQLALVSVSARWRFRTYISAERWNLESIAREFMMDHDWQFNACADQDVFGYNVRIPAVVMGIMSEFHRLEIQHPWSKNLAESTCKMTLSVVDRTVWTESWKHDATITS